MGIIDNLCNDLGLPKGDSFTQDWVYELPEEFRTKEWLDKYILAYSNANYLVPEKESLMELILDVVNDLLAESNEDDEVINKALDLLIDNYQDHIPLINYWSLDGEPLEDSFALTSKMREIKDKIGLL